MRNNILNRLLLISIFALTIGSCDEKEDPSSVVTSFEKFPVTINTAAVVAPEADEETYRFDFKLDDRQITDVVIEVGVGSSSTAEEGEDFELSTHEIELSAFEGQDGFSIDVTVLEDFKDEAGDETIYLTFTTTTPSGIDKSEVLVATITDSNLTPQPGETADFTLRWAFTDPALDGVDACDLGMDLDMTFQPAGGGLYDATDLLGYGAASLACPEHGTLTISDMVDGAVYDIWIAIYADTDYGDLSAMTVFVDYERENTDFNGSFAIEGVFDSRQEDEAAVLMTIQRNGNVLTLKNEDGDVVAEGRIKSHAKFQKVKKRI